ncbi:MAG: glutaredoxin family protein [Oxalobacteraceae bacterium]|jgi:hypothetical protein|nr:glutaredoxin family protein [Oxalobacteraceae bacterium]
MMYFTLYSRTWCHLCDDMLQALLALVGDGYRVDVIDIDADPALVEQYDELVPVLQGCLPGLPPQTLCHYHLDSAAVQQFLDLPAVHGDGRRGD